MGSAGRWGVGKRSAGRSGIVLGCGGAFKGGEGVLFEVTGSCFLAGEAATDCALVFTASFSVAFSALLLFFGNIFFFLFLSHPFQ